MVKEPFERLREARQRAGIDSPAAAARRFGWNQHTYKSHDNGTRGITKEAAQRYAKAYRVSAGWILTGDTTTMPFLVPEEQAVLERFRQLSIEQRTLVLALCESMLGAQAGAPPTSADAPARRRNPGR